jgi:hypothetical protein
VTIEEFAQRHAARVLPIEQVVDDWVAAKRRRDRAHASAFAASVAVDLVKAKLFSMRFTKARAQTPHEDFRRAR